MDPAKPFSHVHLRRAADRNSGVRRCVAILDQNDVVGGEVFGFVFGPWLAISTERVRSLNPCAIRTRDECTKRNGLRVRRRDGTNSYWRRQAKFVIGEGRCRGNPAAVPREHSFLHVEKF